MFGRLDSHGSRALVVTIDGATVPLPGHLHDLAMQARVVPDDAHLDAVLGGLDVPAGAREIRVDVSALEADGSRRPIASRARTLP
jgi:hypothetical protein